ncbi:hypothetical protein F4556_006460 [Kitasatospora gansuensis]|uniref:Uncharacterized protein n=1 Tax=Kitasatospora gansuensis TaxID=258050 RepID=A0A7W7WLC9_9ACTN|nr:hypothetical protein [Kitasatospora gansuensis]MBB4950925.1 hypothetical protein [Kitasatospora gansuensis]
MLGVGGTLGLVTVHAPAAQTDAHGCPVEDTEPPASGPPAAADHTADAANPSWVARTAFDQQAVSSTEASLPVQSPVARGDALVVSMMLTSTCPGAVSVTDSRGDRFQLVGDVSDSLRHRVLVLAAFGAAALTTAHQNTTDTDHCAATGQTTSQWAAVLAVLH